MPIIKSAVKRVKQAEKRRERNVQTKKTLKTSTKALDGALDSKDAKNLDSLLNDVYGAYDTAVKKNLVHKNKAARMKASYSAKVKKAGGTKTTKKKTSAKKPTTKKTTASKKK